MIVSPEITLTPEAVALMAAARQWPRTLTRNLVRTLNRENELTVGHIVQARATGKGPFPKEEGRLGVVTSRYRRSVRPAKAALNGTQIDSAIGSNVRYAGAHEFGVNKTVQVKQHVAKNAWLDQLEVAGRIVPRWESFGLKGRKKKVASGVVTVRAHPMKMNLPARAPIQRGINDRVINYREALSASVVSTFSAAA